MALALVASYAALGAIKIDVLQTARFRDGSTVLMKDQPQVEMKSMADFLPAEHTLTIDTTKTYQEIVGFGGAFTEASAINWRLLSKEDQEKVINLYFAGPEEGGHGYTLGRVPMDSCDFSPESYTFDDVAGDTDLKHFDDSVSHDVSVGMIPMMLAAQEKIVKRGYKMSLYASPWSPPAWMKRPVLGVQSMLASATPSGLMPSMQRVWAKYFSRFISAYRKQGLDMWGVTVQNEPEAAVGWEAMLWSPQFMASFVKNHLGPVLEEEQPGVKIIGFDHNKDHVDIWAKALYEDKDAAKYFAGIGVHWYGGLNTKNLEYTHNLDPTKFILGTEACNCGGVVYEDAALADGVLTKGDFLSAWWTRAEALGLDILEDLKFWAVGWTDWNLVLSTSGGPNHLKNLCDANIIVDPDNTVGHGDPLILQASFYYMGHFSRYVPPGSKRVHLENTVEIEAPPLAPGDVKNGQALLFAPCDGNLVQKWELDEEGFLTIPGTAESYSSDGYEKGGMCMEKFMPEVPWVPGKVVLTDCDDAGPHGWTVRPVTGGSQVYSPDYDSCLTTVATDGGQVGLDKGVKVIAAQLRPCYAAGTANQTFAVAGYDGQGFPDNFPIRTLPSVGQLCLQPQIVRVPHFDAVAFETPDKNVSLITINIGDQPIEFSLVDKAANAGVQTLTIPSHAIHTYRWSPKAGGHASTTSASTIQMVAGQQLPALAAAGEAAAPAGKERVKAGTAVPRQKVGVNVDVRRDRGSPNVALLSSRAARPSSSESSSPGSWAAWAGGGALAIAVAAVVITARRARGVQLVPTNSDAWEACDVANDYQEYSAAGPRSQQ